LRVRVPGQDLLLTLGQQARVRGRVEAEVWKAFRRGDLVAHTWVHSELIVGSYGEIDETGRFDVFLEPGRYVLELSVPGFANSTVEISVRQGETRDILIHLEKGGGIEGKVVSRTSGEPVTSAQVYWESDSSGAFRPWARFFTTQTRGDGTF